MDKKLTELLDIYRRLPEWLEEPLDSVNSVSLFGDYPINAAAARGSLYELKLLLSAGANIDQAGEHGYTPLHNAVEQGAVNVVEYLVVQGADYSQQNDDSITPLELSIMLEEAAIEIILCNLSGDES